MNVKGVRVIEVIEVTSLTGKGVEGDPVRELIQHYSMSGNLLAERDTWEERRDSELIDK